MNMFNSLTQKSVSFIVCLLFWVMLTWCGNSWNIDSNWGFSIKNSWFSLEYNWNVELEWVLLNDEDLNEILALYQETWTNIDYKDSLLIAEKYSWWRGVNTFVQENLDMLEEQWLELDNIKKSQIPIVKNGEKINWVLVEYEIVEWFINKIPKLYISQLFVIQKENIILFSYITENRKACNYATEMFKNIK